MMRSNFWLKIFSLALAIVLAYVVNSDSNTSVLGLVVPLEMQNIPQSKVLLFPQRREIQVTIRGPSFLVSPLASSPPVFKVHLPGNSENRFQINLNPGDLVLPPTVEVLSIEPQAIEIILDDLETRQIRVEVPRIGRLKDEFRIQKVDVTPALVTVSGPLTELKSIKSIETYPLDLRSVEASGSVELQLRMPGSLSSVTPKKVSAYVELANITKERQFLDLPVELRPEARAGEFSAIPQNVSVTLSGPVAQIEELKEEQVKVYVTADKPGDVNVSVDVPSGIKVGKVIPEVVKLKRLASFKSKR